MTTLHISLDVRDFEGWLATFSSFGDFRAKAGVTASTIRKDVDDPRFVAVDLTFATSDAARAHLARLETDVWPSSPHLDGTPSARLLETVG